MPETPLLSFADVMARLRVSRGWLQEFLKRHPHYLKVGRQYRFTEAHLQQILEAMAAPAAEARRRRGPAVPAGPSEAAAIRRLAQRRERLKKKG